MSTYIEAVSSYLPQEDIAKKNRKRITERTLKLLNDNNIKYTIDNNNKNKFIENPVGVIGDNTFTAYCSELTYAYTYKNFVVTPGVQNHNAYHPFLDRKNYEFLMGENAPMYVIDNPDITDNRLAEIQSPQTSEALRLNYSYVTKVEYEIKDHSMPNIVALNKLYVRKNTPSGRVAEKEPFISYDI